MGKKKDYEKMIRKMIKKHHKNYGYGMGMGMGGFGPMLSQMLDDRGNGMFDFLGKDFKNQANYQFVLGLLLGAAGTYIMTDEKLRMYLMNKLMGTYTNVVGGFEEFKEQLADLKAEAEFKKSEEETEE